MRSVPALRVPRPALALAALLVSAGCGGGGSAGGPDPSGPGGRGTLSTAFELEPAQPAQGSEFTATFRYSISPSTVLLGSYLAEVRFDPAQVQLVAADPAMVSSRLVNDADAATGLLIVGGAATNGFRDGLLFKARFRSDAGAVTPATFQLTIREAVDTSLDSLVLN